MIKSVTIQIGKKELKLSLDEVIELRGELNSLTEKQYISYPLSPSVVPYNPSPIWYGNTTTSAYIDTTMSN